MNKRTRQCLMVCLVGLAIELAGIASAQAQQFMANKYTDPVTKEILEYNVVLPPGYNAAADTKYPLLICLHAANNTNPPNRTLSADGKCYVGSFTVPEHPSFFMVPISQTNATGWGAAAAKFPITEPEKFEGRLTVVVVQELLTRYKIDPDRLYITGPSMGGHGTWDIIRRNPTMFAAAAPAAGAADPAEAALYAAQNIWAINGTNDSSAPEMSATIDAIRMLGGNPIYTLLVDRPHNTWRSLYKDPQLIYWMFAQRRGVPWWQHPPAAPTMLQPDPANGSVALAGGVSVVPPPGLGPTTPFPNVLGTTGAGGGSGTAGSFGQGASGGVGGGGPGNSGPGGMLGSPSGGATMPAATGGAAVVTPPGGGGNTGTPVGASSTGGAVATPPQGTPSSSGGAGLPGNPSNDTSKPPGATGEASASSSASSGCSHAGGGSSEGSPWATVLILALLVRLSLGRRKLT